MYSVISQSDFEFVESLKIFSYRFWSVITNFGMLRSEFRLFTVRQKKGLGFCSLHYGHMKAKSLILCGPNEMWGGYKGLVYCRNKG